MLQTQVQNPTLLCFRILLGDLQPVTIIQPNLPHILWLSSQHQENDNVWSQEIPEKKGIATLERNQAWIKCHHLHSLGLFFLLFCIHFRISRGFFFSAKLLFYKSLLLFCYSNPGWYCLAFHSSCIVHSAHRRRHTFLCRDNMRWKLFKHTHTQTHEERKTVVPF